MTKIPVGLQLYTLREETKEDFLGTLHKVAAMGYKAVEFAGYGDVPAKEMKKVLDDLDLTASSSHTIGLKFDMDMKEIFALLDKQMEYNLTIGSHYLISSWSKIAMMNSKEEIGVFAAKLRAVGERCKQIGLQYCYHNHDFEFVKVDDQYKLDVLYNAVEADLLQAELDLYWVQKGGLDPKTYLQSFKGRCPLVHVKDMADDAEQSFAEVGHGIIDYPSIFAVAAEVGVKYYIIEQDICKRPPLESVKMSIDYLKSLGIA
ncbi:sugar phosphate isomerase/epimerase [Paenibacillus sp. N3.4]|uniref:sugar phosphate isomerase/epimerase family protein n=1 Tax=Paenibacillus sp. N3.4 TaxID=2603222 RepID=UPI0011C7F69B|nr:sugar phosphate isomerase/epimerase [Paenibacillus sp. N3.4]TXK77378.1 sugar phosphate isomerase/epimerase [Paenibacillus sp. N3.4]